MAKNFPITEPMLVAIGQIADDAAMNAYVVGGFVRDVLLGRGNDRDIDITVIGDGVAFAKRVAQEFPKSRDPCIVR